MCWRCGHPWGRTILRREQHSETLLVLSVCSNSARIILSCVKSFGSRNIDQIEDLSIKKHQRQNATCEARPRNEICQKFYTTGFLGQTFYTPKVHKLWLFLLWMKQRKCIKTSKLSHFLFKFNWMCKTSTASV